MSFMIRVRDNRAVATHQGDLRGINVPATETVEMFDSRDEFEARLAELAPAPGPDVDALLDAVYDQLGRGQARTLLRDYPDMESALKRGKWGRAWQALDDAVNDGALTTDERDAIAALATEHNIPQPESA